MYVRDHAAAVIRLDATIAFLAAALSAFGEPDPEETRRVKALAVLANPLQAVQLLAAYQARTQQRANAADRGPGYAEDQPLPDGCGDNDIPHGTDVEDHSNRDVPDDGGAAAAAADAANPFLRPAPAPSATSSRASHRQLLPPRRTH